MANIEREEYEKRHQELEKQVSEIKANFILFAQSINTKFDAVSIRIDSQIEKLETTTEVQIEKLEVATELSLEKLQTELVKSRIGAWQFIAFSLANLLFSGGLIGWLTLSGHIR